MTGTEIYIKARQSYIYPIVEKYPGVALSAAWKESRKEAQELVKNLPEEERDQALQEILNCLDAPSWCRYVYERVARDIIATK